MNKHQALFLQYRWRLWTTMQASSVELLTTTNLFDRLSSIYSLGKLTLFIDKLLCRYGHPPLKKQHIHILGGELYMLIQKSGQDKCVFHVLKFAGWLKSLISCDIFSYRFLFVCFKDPSLFSLATSIFPWFCCFLLWRFAWISNQVTIQHTKHC